VGASTADGASGDPASKTVQAVAHGQALVTPGDSQKIGST
jgi:hypothetical protein